MNVMATFARLGANLLGLKSAPVEAALDGPTDVVKLCQELGPFARPLPHIPEPEKALDLQAPALRRPVLLVHGLAKHGDTWVNMKNFLCGNLDNSYGGLYRAGQRHQFYEAQMKGPPAQVFIINISDNLASPADTFGELQEALGAIRAATGAPKIDIVTHSMGSYVARAAARAGAADQIGNLVMLAPPNQGAYGANLLLNARMVGYDRYPEGHTGALEALSMAKGPLGGVANPFLDGLNEDWAETSQHFNSAIITGIGVPTPDRAWKGVSAGDGMVAVARAPLGDTPLYVAGDRCSQVGDPYYRDFEAFRYNHNSIVSDAEVYQQISQMLSQPLPNESLRQAEHQIDMGEVEATFKPPAPRVETQQTLF